MEVFQLKTNSWFLPRELFLPDPLLSSEQSPVLCHILTGTLAVALRHRLSVTNYQQNLMSYLWRFRAGEGVLRVYNVSVKQVARSEAEIEVLCQRLCFRPEIVINALPVQEQLYVIASIVKTAQLLTDTFGYFGVTLPMLGLDKNGELRMWINSNHAENKREIELQNEEQQFAGLLQLFVQLRVESRLVNAYLHNFKVMDLRFKNHMSYHQKFMRLHHLQIRSRVSVAKLAVQTQSQLSRERDFESCPTSSLKLANETADMTSTLKEHSLNSKIVHSKIGQLCKSSDFPKRFQKMPNNRFKGSKENRKSLQKSSKSSLKSSFCNTKLSGYQTQEGVPQSPGHYLATRAKLEESFLLQESLKPQPNMAAVAVNLQLLGKMGKFCESMTAEELILQEFKSIYQ